MTNTLPTAPSALIRVALADLKTCEDSSTYRIDMGRWHGPASPSTCAVCLAGSVMAQSLDARHGTPYRPYDFPGVEDSLYAINYFRAGSVRSGLASLGRPVRLGDRDIVDYHEDRETFHREMAVLALDLEGVGL